MFMYGVVAVTDIQQVYHKLHKTAWVVEVVDTPATPL
jgi:hypothetical protein